MLGSGMQNAFRAQTGVAYAAYLMPGIVAIANNIEPLRRLLEARKRLSDLVTYMDGRGDAELLISESLRDPRKLMELVNGERERVEEVRAASASAPADDAGSDTEQGREEREQEDEP